MAGSIEIKNRLYGYGSWIASAAPAKPVYGGVVSVVNVGAGLYDVTLADQQIWDPVTGDVVDTIAPIAATSASGINGEVIAVVSLTGGNVLRVETRDSVGGTNIQGQIWVWSLPTID